MTGGAGSICSAQTRALVHLGANACIIGRNAAKTEKAAREIAQVRKGSKVIGIGGVDVRDVRSGPAGPRVLCPTALIADCDTNSSTASKEQQTDVPPNSGPLTSSCMFQPLPEQSPTCMYQPPDGNSAGAAGNFISPLSALSPNGFKAVIEIDTIGTFNTIKATIPYLVQSAARNPNPNPSGSTGGRIVAVSATFHYTGMPLQSHVSAAKAAVDSLMASVALEYGPLGVTANVVAPGAIAGTEGMERLASSELDTKQRTSGVPSGRWGTVRDIADATVFVLSDAGNYVNGSSIVVDGAGWRRHGSLSVGLDADMKYPDFLISGEISKNLKDGRKAAKL